MVFLFIILGFWLMKSGSEWIGFLLFSFGLLLLYTDFGGSKDDANID